VDVNQWRGIQRGSEKMCCEFLGSPSAIVVGSVLLGFKAESHGVRFPTFRRFVSV
jgi:hypothetical protein